MCSASSELAFSSITPVIPSCHLSVLYRQEASETSPYLKFATLEGFHEVLRLTAKNGPMDTEAFGPADDLAVRECFGLIEAEAMSVVVVQKTPGVLLTSRSLLSVQSRFPWSRPYCLLEWLELTMGCLVRETGGAQ